MKKNKGFTLIELLAVIVILAIIALISVPLIMGIIEKTQESAYKESLRSIFQATDIYLATNEFGDVPEDGIDVTNPNFPLKNNMFLSGRIVKNAQGQLELNNVTNGQYCGSGTLDNIVVVKESCDTTAPVITVSPTTVEISLGSTYSDVGVTASDDIEGNITDRIVVTGEVNTSTIGSYTLTYNVSDSSGNAATEKTRTVNVIAALASLTTNSNVTNITSTGAIISGEVTSDGGGTITERGIVYGTSPNPTISDTKLVVSGTTGTFAGNLTSLANDTTYYARSYATNSTGTSYGNQITLLTNMGGIDSYTKLMLHFDGADNGTVFTDETGKTITRYGNTVTRTTDKKIGAASAYYDGSGDYLGLNHSTDFEFGTGDYTVEAWVKFSAKPSIIMIIGKYVDINNFFYPLYWSSSNRLIHRIVTGGSNRAEYWCSFTPNLNQWYHLAVVRRGSNCYMYIDGVSQTVNTTTSFNGNINATNGVLIGAADSTSYFHSGYLDELRISKGIARWTSDFVPPTKPYTE